MDEKTYLEARKRVKKKKDFYEHLTTFLVMSVFFFVLNMMTAPGSWWFYWPILGWGMGVLFHYLDTFGLPFVGTLSQEWEKKAFAEEVQRLEGKDPKEEEEYLELRELKRSSNRDRRWRDEDLV